MVERLGVERIEAAGRTVIARHYRLQGDLNCELWYGDQQWSKLRFAARDGSTIEYRLDSANVGGAPWLTPTAGGNAPS
jgi:hypothetical protein